MRKTNRRVEVYRKVAIPRGRLATITRVEQDLIARGMVPSNENIARILATSATNIARARAKGGAR